MNRRNRLRQSLPLVPAGVIAEIAFAALIGLSGMLVCALVAWIRGIT